ncbi:MAG: haloacid dehalogenase [Armatimonadetes bacterium]|nr:haloacid dehalogenase [Armatimonadota bacterium]
MSNIEIIAEEIRNILDETNQVREDALRLSREVVRLSANSIRASHREDYEEACVLKSEARAKVEETRELLRNKPEVYFTGYVQDAQKEYAEAELTYAIIRELPLPRHNELLVEPAAYLNGLAEAIGESRRHVLDVLRYGNLERAERILNIMDEVYYALITFDYPDAVTQGLRRQTDMVRGVLERTRSDITLLCQQRKLENALEAAMEQFSDGSNTRDTQGGN